jgi:hypothetical protein
MSETQQTASHAAEEPYESERTGSTAWVGMIVFAAVMLILVGTFQAIEGFVAIVKDEYYHVTRDGLVLTFDFTAWGWTHLIIGALAVVTGVGLFLGQMWARVLGIGIAGLSALSNLAFLPAYPVWCTIIIAIDVLVIYALTVHGREMRGR